MTALRGGPRTAAEPDDDAGPGVAVAVAPAVAVAVNPDPAARAGTRARLREYLGRPFTSVHLVVLTAGGLLVVGLLMSASTTIAASHESGTTMWSQIEHQVLFLALGTPVAWFAIRLPPRGYRLLAYPALGLAVVLLAGTLVVGSDNGTGALRWLDLGPVQLQPSEFAKVALLLWGGDLLARKQELGTLRRARHLFVPLVPGFAIVCLLIMLEPDLGTTMCFLLILLGLLWTVGMPFRYFATVVLAVAGAVTLLAVTASYRLARLTGFLHPFKDPEHTGYHAVESFYSLASGGIFGVGLGEGTSKYGWVPNANTDFVFSTIGEELGLIGCLFVLGLFGLLAYTGVRISRRTADPFVRVVAGAAVVWISGQAVINVGYVTGLLPVTGIPLPFVSAGGTSLLATIFVAGMLLSFARHEPAAVAAARPARGRPRSRLSRWTRVPPPSAYRPRKRR